VTQRLIICILIILIIKNSWIAYVLFLIFLGGIIILFVYICRLVANETFGKKIKTNKIIITIIICIIIVVISDPHKLNNNIDFKIFFFKIFNKTLIRITIILIVYLLLVLIIVVKNTSLYIGPLRTKKNV